MQYPGNVILFLFKIGQTKLLASDSVFVFYCSAEDSYVREIKCYGRVSLEENLNCDNM